MNKLEGFLNPKIEKLDQHLKGRVSDEERVEIADSVQHLNFPGLMTLLALGKKAEPPKKAKEEPTQPFRVGGLQTGEIKEKALRAALDKVAEERGLPVTSEQVEKAWELLRTGEFYADVASGAAAIIHVIPNLPLSLLRDTSKAPKLPFALITGAAKDLGDSLDSLPDILEDLEDGKLDQTPKVMTNTLGVLFRQSQSVSSIIETVRTLIGPENESVRLAIIVYARSQGVNINEDDLDAVHQALDTDNPNLGPVVLAGFDYLEREYGVKTARRVVRRMKQHEGRTSLA